MRAGHGRTVIDSNIITCRAARIHGGTHYLHARSGDINPATVVGETGRIAIDIGGADIHAVGARSEIIGRAGIAVTGRYDHHHVLSNEVVTGRAQTTGIRASGGEVDRRDVFTTDFQLGHVIHGLRYIIHNNDTDSLALILHTVADAARHNLDTIGHGTGESTVTVAAGDPGHRISVIGYGRNGPGHVCAVAVAVEWIVIGAAAIKVDAGINVPVGALDKVPADHVIDITIAIIINAVADDFLTVDPDIAVGADIIRARRVAATQVAVVILHTGVQNTHYDGGITGLLIPGHICLDTVGIPIVPLVIRKFRRRVVIVTVVRGSPKGVYTNRLDMVYQGILFIRGHRVFQRPVVDSNLVVVSQFPGLGRIGTGAPVTAGELGT